MLDYRLQASFQRPMNCPIVQPEQCLQLVYKLAVPLLPMPAVLGFLKADLPDP